MMKKISVLFLTFMLLFTMVNIATVSADGPDAIYIYDNSDFATYASSGSGIVSDPYIIDNDYIVSYGGYGIYIENTDAYCIVDNFTILGDSPGYGIYLDNVANVNFTNGQVLNQRNGMMIYNSSNIAVDSIDFISPDGDYGIKLDVSDNILVNFCYFEGVADGIQVWDCFRLRITSNQFVGTGLSFYGTNQVSTAVQLSGNTVNGLPIGYLYNVHDMTVSAAGYGQLILVNSVNVTVHSGNVNNTNYGMQFIFCQNSILALSNITNCGVGVLFYESSECRLYSNNITGNVHGTLGYFAFGTRIYENNYLDNTGYGIWMWYGCSSSSIYLNNFINNQLSNARDDGGIENSDLTWVAGRFVNRVSGWPLSNVSVTVERAGRTHVAYTNLNGILKLPVPAFGTYDLTIEKFRYQTKTPSVTISTPGIHLFEVDMDKANLGPGTGFVQMRFMDGVTPIVGVTALVYSYLDGAYYYHSTEVSAASPAGWVNITGLYYDDYRLVISHPDYYPRIISQVVISDGLVGTYNNIQLTPYVAPDPSDYVEFTVIDSLNDLPVAGATVGISNPAHGSYVGVTDVNGFVNFTGLVTGIYDYNVTMTGYDTYYDDVDLEFENAQLVYFVETAAPEGAGGMPNEYDNNVIGNYWDEFDGGLIPPAYGNPYYIPGDNLDSPRDEYWLLEPYVSSTGPVITESEPTTTIEPPITTTSPTIPVEPTEPTEDYDFVMVVRLVSVVSGIVIFAALLGIYRRD